MTSVTESKSQRGDTPASPAPEQAAQEPQKAAQHQRRPEIATEAPPGWSYNPSAWSQRFPILTLALISFAIATYLALCEVGVLRAAWDPFFGQGTTRILHSGIAQAFPIPDAVIGAGFYLLEMICLLLGDARRWYTKPWLVLSFGLLVIPLGLTSLILMMLQPIVVGNWCSLCLVVAACTFLLAALASDEVVAACQFLITSARVCDSLWETFWHGGRRSQEAENARNEADASRPAPFQGLNVPWSLLVNIALGCWLLAAPPLLQGHGQAAHSNYVVGALVLAGSIVALSEVARPVRFLCVVCGVWLLLFAPWTLLDASYALKINDVCVGVALIVLSFRRGPVRENYNGWNHMII